MATATMTRPTPPPAGMRSAPSSNIVISPSNNKSGGMPSSDVPIFLQKAYHMIDTCDPKICGWSDDGLTFIVKNTSLFETVIIPQFFKHNKFSSFVRQLNFYGFRKVKFSDSLRIDRELEAQTAKFWKFKHDKFRRGRRDLLVEIKRTPNSSSTTASSASAAKKVPTPLAGKAAAAPVPMAALSSSTLAVQPSKHLPLESKPEEVTHLKTEMQELKQRIASMTKNIDELTDLVKKVSVKDNEGGKTSPMVSPGASPDVGLGNKRKKTDGGEVKREADLGNDDLPIMPDWSPSSSMPDWNPSSSDLAGAADSLLLPDLPVSGGPSSLSPSPVPSDEAFVDELFQAFVDEDDIVPGLTDGLVDESIVADNIAPNNDNKVLAEESSSNPNKPDPQLMKRIEDSLSTIPKAMHEMVADRLIDAISQSSLKTVEAQQTMLVDEDFVAPDDNAGTNNINTSLAASIPLATALKILAEYGVSVECTRASGMDGSRFARSLPVVPMHA